MIDVTIQPVGRTLLGIALGSLKYQAYTKQKQVDALKKQYEDIKAVEKENEFYSELAFDVTTRMIDKRFKTSKEYIKTGRASDLQFKKSTTAEDRALQQVIEKQALTARLKYNKAVNNFNKTLASTKVKAAFKFQDIKKVI